MRLTRTLSIVLDSVLTLLYPQQCALCGSMVDGRADGVVCKECWANARLFRERDSICWKCGRPTLKAVAVKDPESIRCGACDDAPFTALRACGFYEGALRAAVLALKREPYLSLRMVDQLCRVQQRPPLDRATMIVPVPLHPQRERSRGFNQSALIAGYVARCKGLPFSEANLIRISHTEQYRAGMDARARHDTVANAFKVQHPALVSGENVLLVDDVFTTGATVSSSAKALLNAGAAEVLVLTIARARSH
jgi:ComF family protein